MGLLGWTWGNEKKKLDASRIVPKITVTQSIEENHVNVEKNEEIMNSAGSNKEEINATIEDNEVREAVKEETVNEYPTILTTFTSSTDNKMAQQQNNNQQRQNAAAISADAVMFDTEQQRVIANPSRMTVVTMESNEQPLPQNAIPPKKTKFPVADLLFNFVCIVLAVFIPEAIFRLIGPYHRGFFCHDDTIRLPYKGSTVPVWLLVFYCVALTGFTIVLGERFRLKNPKTANERISNYEKGEPFRVRLLIRWAFFHGYFLIAFASTLIFTSMAKYPVGRLRPNFIDVCKPTIGNITEIDFCKDPLNQHKYVENYICTGEFKPSVQADARLSFFSGHSSLAMCAAVFTVIYIQSRLSSQFRHVVLVPLLQVAILSSAMFIAYSRIQDHMHHWADVLIGMSTGTSVATFVALNVVGFHLKSRQLAKFLPLSTHADENDKKGDE